MGAIELDDEVHVLDDEEQQQLVAIERAMVGRAALFGALSGTVAAVADVLAQPYLDEGASFLENSTYWLIVGSASVAATIAEIALLYWDSLRSVHALARAAGVPLFPQGLEEGSSPLATTLTRAALELPNPPEGPYGIDPYREVSRLQLAVASLIYKLKVSITNLLTKVVLRRLLGRSALRVYLEFVGVPVYALWNGFVAFLIVREARLRAIGPSAARVYAEAIFGDTTPAEDERIAAWSAVAAAVVRTHDVHPNLAAMLGELETRFGRVPEARGIDDTGDFLRQLERLPAQAQGRILAWLHVAAVIDGRVTRAERRLLDQAYGICGRERDRIATRRLRDLFVSGRAVPPGLFKRLAGHG